MRGHGINEPNNFKNSTTMLMANLFADPCFYNGSCTNTDGSYQCKCTSTKTGKKCELEKAACAGNPCNGSDICALSERSSRGFQCVNKQLETVMILSEDKYSNVYDLEKEIENLIKTAPSNANAVRQTFGRTKVIACLRPVLAVFLQSCYCYSSGLRISGSSTKKHNMQVVNV